VGAHEPDALPERHGRGCQGAGDPIGLVAVQSQGLGEELLVRHREQHRPPRVDQVSHVAGDLQGVIGVLAEVLSRVDQQPVFSYAGGYGHLHLTGEVHDRC
jgi:hypothetical protein